MSAKWYKERLDDVEKTIKLGGFEMPKKVIRIVFAFIFIVIGAAQISQAKDFLDLSKLVLSFAFGMWVSKWI